MNQVAPLALAMSSLLRATTVADRWVIGSAALGIGLGLVMPLRAPGTTLEVWRDNHLTTTLPLENPRRLEVPGRLGTVIIEVADGSARILEFTSPRMVGTRTGWISSAGQLAACVPCGVLIRVQGTSSNETRLDAISN